MNLNGDSFDTGNGATKTITTAVFNKNVWLIVYKGTTVNNLTFYPMLIKSTKDKPYEQYGASPSIDYPSEIKTVKDSVQVNVSNSNMLDFNVAQNEKVTVNDDGTITINGTGGFFLNFKEISLKKGITYYTNYQVISGTAINSKEEGKIFLKIRNAQGKYLQENSFNEDIYQDDITSSGIWIHSNAVFTNAKIKIWTSTEKSDFVPHQSQTVIMPIQQEMLEGDYIDEHGEHHEWGKLVLTGDEKDSVFEQKESATGLVYFRVNCNWKKQNGKVLSNMLKVSTKHLSEIEQNADLIYSIVSGNEFFIMLKDSSITSVALLKAKLKELNEAGTPLTIYYEIRKDVDVNIYVDAPKTRYLLNDEQNEALTTELNAYQNITNIDASNELASVDVTYYTNNKSNKIYVKEYELEKLDKQLGNEFQKLDSNIQKLKSATEYPNYFLRLISAKSTQKYTINSGEITQIQLEKFNYNGSFYGEFISVYSGMIDISRDIYLDISGAIKFYTSPKENCNISLCLLKYLYDNETESFSVKEELFSTDILKATTDSKVSAVIPSTIIYAQTNDIVGLGFKSDISGEYTIMQDYQNSFLKIRPIPRIIQRPQ